MWHWSAILTALRKQLSGIPSLGNLEPQRPNQVRCVITLFFIQSDLSARLYARELSALRQKRRVNG
jgi:hypothetical protein